MRVLGQLSIDVLKIEVSEDATARLHLISLSRREKIEHDLAAFVPALELLNEVIVAKVYHPQQGRKEITHRNP